jgi:Ni/Fe-hydrogenase subunit HybB-like protein
MASILYFIPALKSGPLTYYLFLPAAMKLFAILIFRWRAVIAGGQYHKYLPDKRMTLRHRAVTTIE